MRTIWYIATKDMAVLFAEKTGAFFAVGWPIMIAVFFGLLFSGASDPSGWRMHVAVVDEDQTPGSAAFIKQLSEAKELTVIQTARGEANENVRKGKWTAYVVLPSGFGQARDHPFQGRPASMEIGIDPSRQAEAGLLQGVLMKQLFRSYEDMFKDRARMRDYMAEGLSELDQADDMDPITRKLLSQFLTSAVQLFDELREGSGASLTEWQPFEMKKTDVVRQREGPRSSYEWTFPQGLSWAFICCTAIFGIGLVVERTRGTLRRLQAAPLTRSHILGGKALACFLTTVLVSAVILGIGVLAFGLRPQSYPLLGLAVGAASVCFVGIMMLVSVLGRTEQTANAFAWPIFMVMAMTGGGMLPLVGMPRWLQAISDFSPLKWAVLALEGAIWRGFSLPEMVKPCAILAAVGMVCFAVGVRLFPWTHEG